MSREPPEDSSVVRMDRTLHSLLKTDAALQQIAMRAHLDNIVGRFLRDHGHPETKRLAGAIHAGS